MTDSGDIIRNLNSDLLVTYQDLRSNHQIDHSIEAYINRIWQLRGDDGRSLPIPVNPAYEFSQNCHPYTG